MAFGLSAGRCDKVMKELLVSLLVLGTPAG